MTRSGSEPRPSRLRCLPAIVCAPTTRRPWQDSPLPPGRRCCSRPSSVRRDRRLRRRDGARRPGRGSRRRAGGGARTRRPRPRRERLPVPAPAAAQRGPRAAPHRPSSARHMRALAAALPTGDRTRIWHLAESTVGTDPALPTSWPCVAESRPRPARTSGRVRRARTRQRSSRPTRTWQRNVLPSLLTMPSSPGMSHECARSSTGCSPSVRSTARVERRCSRSACSSSTPDPCRGRRSTSTRRRTCSRASLLVRCSHRARDGAFPAQRPGRVRRVRPADRRGRGPRRPRAAADGELHRRWRAGARG